MSSLMVLISVPTISPVVLETGDAKAGRGVRAGNISDFQRGGTLAGKVDDGQPIAADLVLTWIPAVLLMASRTS